MDAVFKLLFYVFEKKKEKERKMKDADEKQKNITE